MTAHPYMPNSTPSLLTASSSMPSVRPTSSRSSSRSRRAHRLEGGLDLPPALASEASLRRHLLDLLARNETCERNLSFLGGGIWQHHVPAIVDEIARRSEFLTPVWGTPSSDHGRNQAWFEFASQLGELIGMEFVGLPVYSWGCAEGHAIRMAARLTGRSHVLVPATMSPERLAVIRTYCGSPELTGHVEVELVGHDAETGGLDLDDLRAKLSSRTAAVLFENPGYLGTLEQNAAEIAALARAAGAETIVGVDPISLGIVAPPSEYGADIVVGSVQPLGVHMSVRRWRRRLHRHPRRGALRARVPDAQPEHRPRRSRASTASGSRSSSRRRTGCARTATTGRATPSTCTRSRMPPTWR